MPMPSAAGSLRLLFNHPRYLQHLIAMKMSSLARYRWAERNEGRDDDVPPPLGYKVVLTYRCNLRCAMCYQWGDVGWCHEAARPAMVQELDWPILERLVAERAVDHPYFIL